MGFKLLIYGILINGWRVLFFLGLTAIQVHIDANCRGLHYSSFHKHEFLIKSVYKPVIKLDGAVGYRVVLESHEMKVKNRRERREDDALFSVLNVTKHN